MKLHTSCSLLLICGILPLYAAVNDKQPIVAKYVGVYRTPPSSVGALDPSIKTYRIPDGPLMGNGDLAVAVGGTYTNQTFYLSKSDLSQSVRGIGGLTIAFADDAGETVMYRQEQDLFNAEVRSVIPLRRTTVRMRSYTTDNGNVLVSDLWTDGAEPLDISLCLWSHTDRSVSQAGTTNDIIWSTREITGTVGVEKKYFYSKVAMATRVLGALSSCGTDGKKSSRATFTLSPRMKVRIVTVVAGGYGVSNHIEQALAAVSALTNERVEELYDGHKRWWKGYWLKSEVDLGDELLEKFYYGALYVLGCSSRAGCIAPGLAGPWHLHGPVCWGNRYTLDYNFESVWWGVYSSNRPELAEPYYDVIMKLIPAGKLLAQEHNTKGILFGVNAHAWGGFTDTRTLNMKGNASLAALNFIMHYKYTQDETFLTEKLWPLLKELAVFWEDNLEWESASNRWVIRDSGAREGQKDTNAINDLGYVRALFSFLLDISDTLEGKRSENEVIHISQAQKQKWHSYVENLSAFPTLMLDGKKVFKEAENRKKMSLGGAGDNSDVLFPVFPCEVISLSSPPELLEVARNTVAALNPDGGKASWFQANCFPKIYTQAVRSGYPAEKIVANLKLLLQGRQPYDDRGDHVQLRDNLTIVPPAHSLEYVGAIEAINSMLLQSHDNIIRVFPNWLPNRDAGFRDLRAVGAFLVSSEYTQGRVTYVDIKSEAGRLCRIVNPFIGKTCEVLAINGEQLQPVVFRLDNNVIHFNTEKGQRYRIRAK